MRKRTAVHIIQATKALDPGAFRFAGNPGDLKTPIIMEEMFRRFGSLHNVVLSPHDEEHRRG